MEPRAGDSVVVGMSGGVDSTYAAHSLVREGLTVAGLTLRFFSGMGQQQESLDELAVKRARHICERLDIEHIVIDAGELFRGRVVDYLVRSYGSGATPNPCVTCNRHIKFPLLAEAADRLGAGWIATGHYARVEIFGEKPVIAAASDRNKDQSYFLYRLTPEILERSIFPLGRVGKDEVRAALEDIDLPARERESQDICFMGEEGLEGFLEARLAPSPGDVLNTRGEKIGTHRGSCFYTVGQRKGLGVAAGTPLYVIRKDTDRNLVFLGEGEELLSRKAVCRDIVLTERLMEMPLRGKIRYRHGPARVENLIISKDEMTVIFTEPQRAVTPGQSLVLYRGDLVAGGGIITGDGKR
ncbi:MAG: tRNA 2-thiouridine(34) synthase MnmA [Candidatus Latescibacteria bacterium]|nr:tRNA 2-thiouridine(34) synthase MnmA [bacterium]MBD3423503.1 tRNA 2-thiouridine(34) synthase MnmA [Candidatus Latescibacterota bacterium]